MRGGVVVGAQGDGGWRSSIPENGCGRWSLDLGARRIGDRVLVVVVGPIRCGCACAKRLGCAWDRALGG